jgi:UDP-N-acetylmuramate--alanine ligase
MEPRIYHLIGIGGIGMSGLARIANGKGDIVSGSDMRDSQVIQSLLKEGIKVFIGHDASYLPENCKVVYSTDIPLENPEIQEAKKRGYPIIHRSIFLKELMEGSLPLLVTGTHGKTSTSSLLAHTLNFLHEDPSYSIGGIIQNLQSNGHYGKGKWFVAEADESDRSFLAYSAHGAVITNIGLDHLNVWGNEGNILKGFLEFYQNVQNKDLFFWCADDKRLNSLSLHGTSYGFSSSAMLQIEKVSYRGWKSFFTLRWGDKVYTDIEIPLIGPHNVLNCTAIFGLCLQLGFGEVGIREAFKAFIGVKRRVEKKGEEKSVTVYDDYGHHPTEILTTLKSLKKASEGRRVVVAFQPHRFTRTRDCFNEFAPALQQADVVVLTDVYSAGESPIEAINSKTLHNTFLDNVGLSCYVPKQELLEKLLNIVEPGDVVVTMGAGDITELGPQLLDLLRGL